MSGFLAWNSNDNEGSLYTATSLQTDKCSDTDVYTSMA